MRRSASGASASLLGANRSSRYYQPLGESEENLQLMRLLDGRYTRTPFYGSRRMVEWLATQGFEVNRKRVARLMEGMGIEAASLSPESEHWLDWFHIRMCLTVTGRSIIIKVQQLQTGGLVNEIEKIISQLEQQKASIEKAIIALRQVSGLAVEESETIPSEQSRVEKPKRHISPEGRARIAEASRRRWAAKRAAEKAAAKESKPAKKKASTAKKKTA